MSPSNSRSRARGPASPATKKPATGPGSLANERAATERRASNLKDAVGSERSDSISSAPSTAMHSSSLPEPSSSGSSSVPSGSASSAALDARDVKDDELKDGELKDGKDGKKDRAPSAAQTLALELANSMDGQAVLRHAIALEDDREATANQAARLIQELAELKPELLVPLIERFSRLLVSKNKRVVASSASALAPLSRIAPAKVAKQLPLLTQNWEHTTEEGKDGLVRTFAGLCTASVAYQKRLEPALARALGEAEPKLLIRWTEIVLPALKGEPHARARAVVEERLPNIPRPQAQKIADFLGIKLRPLAR
jgi:hypothetical protein